jgi:hypothetical protein
MLTKKNHGIVMLVWFRSCRFYNGTSQRHAPRKPRILRRCSATPIRRMQQHSLAEEDPWRSDKIRVQFFSHSFSNKKAL